MRRFILGICLLAAIANIDAAAQKRLTILHVNDTHSHLEPERSGCLLYTSDAADE